MKQHICVLFGGVSTEHKVSCVSASFVISNLDREKYDVSSIGITENGEWYLYKGSIENIKNDIWYDDKENLVPAVISPCSLHHGYLTFNKPEKKFEIHRVDAVFPVLHGKNGEDGTMQGLLTLAGIPFVGCDTCSSALGMDKVAAKVICEREGIVTAPFLVCRNNSLFDAEKFADEVEANFAYPVFVKPANAGSSVGITKAKNRQMLLDGIRLAFENDGKVLVEKEIKGKEVEVAVIGNADPVAVGCGEIAPNADFYDYDTKYVTDTSEAFIPARIADSVAKRVCENAERIYRVLGCSGLSRVDFFVDGENIVFNEINTIPGFTSISMYPKINAFYGRGSSALLDELISLALEAKR